MPMRLGVLAYPAFVLMIQMTRPSAVPAFERVSAYDEATSRRPASLEVPHKAVARAVRKGLLVPVGDGRYYLDRDAVRRADRRNLTLMLASGVVMIPLLWLLL